MSVRELPSSSELAMQCSRCSGFILVMYNGGHSLECLDEDSVMLEFKNGPYIGRDFQTFLDP